MGAGATPLSKIFDTAGAMSAEEALSVMTPAGAIGNAISIVIAGIANPDYAPIDTALETALSF